MNELERRYRVRLAELRAQIVVLLDRLYADRIDPADLDAAFSAFNPQAAIVLRAGQSRAVSLATGYLSALVTLMGGRRADLSAFTAADIIGTTATGLTLVEGMDAFPALVKAQIGKGADTKQAVEYGRFLAERFGDAEVTSAVDRHTEAVTTMSGEFSGWEGIVSGNACDPCGANAGFHALDEPIYRHGNCNCTKQYVVR